MAPTQKALLIEHKGGPFVIGTRPIPTPGPGELLVKIHAAGLNPVDWKIQALGLFVTDFPAVVGTDVAGSVEALGEGVQDFQKGDRVFFQGPFIDSRYGAFQEYTIIATDITVKIPPNITYAEAASIPVAFNCAAIGLFAPVPVGLGLTPPFDRKPHYSGPALVIGGSSSVGQYAIQLLKLAGFAPIITYASAPHSAYLTSLGATHVVDRASTPLAALQDTITTHTKAPVLVVFDAISSPETQRAGYAVLAAGGGMVVTLDLAVPEDSDGKRALHVLGSVHVPAAREFGRTLMPALAGLVEDGLIVANRVEELPGGLQGIRDGLGRLQRGEVSGVKLVGNPSESQ
ncbi:chaperonin 10-like protein [Mycena crocata]|nr:chaperonin 10-like protein [Mycena crocata]